MTHARGRRELLTYVVAVCCLSFALAGCGRAPPPPLPTPAASVSVATPTARGITGREITLDVDPNGDTRVYVLGFTPPGYLAVLVGEMYVEYDTTTGARGRSLQLLQRLQPASYRLPTARGGDIDAEGSRVAVAFDGAVALYDLPSGARRWLREGVRTDILRLVGDELVVASTREVLRLDASDGGIRSRWALPNPLLTPAQLEALGSASSAEAVTRALEAATPVVALSRSGARVAIGSSSAVVFDTATGEPVSVHALEVPARSPQSERCLNAIALDDHDLVVLAYESGTVRYERGLVVVEARVHGFPRVALDASGQRAVASGVRGVTMGSTMQVPTLSLLVGPGFQPMNAPVLLSADGRTCAALSRERLVIWTIP